MSEAKQLYDMQELDLDIDSRRQELSKTISSIGESNALIEGRVALVQQQKKLEETEHLMRGLEMDVEDARAKAAVAGDRLYGGAVKNPKELVSLKEQVESYNRKIKELEDKILELMTEVEAEKDRIKIKQQEVVAIEEEWKKAQGVLLQERADLDIEIAKLELNRNEMVAKVDAATLKLYENLRNRRQGKAVARVEQGMCQGCRIVLPINKLKQIKTGNALVQCGSCERILYLS
ncbi:MAG: C4-type zinc ribbon domain-containing protein [Dehalococcoidia bacterium]